MKAKRRMGRWALLLAVLALVAAACGGDDAGRGDHFGRSRHRQHGSRIDGRPNRIDGRPDRVDLRID